MKRREVSIGRSSSCDICLNKSYEYASTYHGTIYCEGDKFFFKDTSTNGTIINNKFVHKMTVQIERGDEILIAGKYPIRWSQIESCINSFEVPFKRTKLKISFCSNCENRQKQKYHFNFSLFLIYVCIFVLIGILGYQCGRNRIKVPSKIDNELNEKIKAQDKVEMEEKLKKSSNDYIEDALRRAVSEGKKHLPVKYDEFLFSDIILNNNAVIFLYLMDDDEYNFYFDRISSKQLELFKEEIIKNAFESKKDIKQFVLYCAASNRLIIYRIKSKKFKLKQIDIKFDYKEFMHRLSNYENYGRPY